MKADRLVATLLLLQARQKVTAAEVALELEVSERTARRDLEALSAAGIPVYAQPGRTGGWSLIGGARTDLTGLTAAEARALFTVAGPAAAATPELRAALRGLVRALPEPFRASAETASRSVVIDPGAWGSQRAPVRPRFLDALQAAVTSGVQVRLGYADREGKTSVRVVHPLGLAVKGTVWYLVAGTDAGQRTFRVGRVRSVEETDVPVERPAGFDLAEAWREIVANVDSLRSPLVVEAMVDAELVPVLNWLFERQLRVEVEAASDVGVVGGAAPARVLVRIGGRHIEQIAGQLAGFGSRVEVLSPPAARDYLAQIGAELVASYR